MGSSATSILELNTYDEDERLASTAISTSLSMVDLKPYIVWHPADEPLDAGGLFDVLPEHHARVCAMFGLEPDGATSQVGPVSVP
jgi:hypothetical protein